MKKRASNSQTQWRGFSLVEAAIVLGVVGLVVGGIWVSASAVRKNQANTTLAENIFMIARETQNLIGRRQAIAIGDVHIESLLIASGIIPATMVNGADIVTSFGSVTIAIGHTTTEAPRFTINLFDLPYFSVRLSCFETY